jgi:hypothetical protein
MRGGEEMVNYNRCLPSKAFGGCCRSCVVDLLDPAVDVLRRALLGAEVLGALRVDEPQEDGRPQRGAGLAEGGGDAMAGGARLGGENLGGDLGGGDVGRGWKVG